MTPIRFSILIAVYNAERFLPKCLDSLLAQTYPHFEAICIDDASTDGSLSLLNEYAQRDARLKVISMPHNNGQAVARNEGLKYAIGQFTVMLDSDDWYAPTTLEKLNNALQSEPEADCALLRLVLCHADGREQVFANSVPEGEVINGEMAFSQSINWRIHGVYAVRTALHKHFPYDTACRLYSDDNTTHIHYLHARKVLLTNAPYYYRQHAASTTHALTIRRLDRITANLSLKRQIEQAIVNGQLSHPQKVMHVFETHRWRVYVQCYALWRTTLCKILTVADNRAAVSLFKQTYDTFTPSLLPWRVRLHPGFLKLPCFAQFCTFVGGWYVLRKYIIDTFKKRGQSLMSGAFSK